MANSLIPLSETNNLTAAGAGTWDIERVIPDDVNPNLVGVDVDMLGHWTNYISGIGDFVVTSAAGDAFRHNSFLGRDFGAESVTTKVQHSMENTKLPSSY